MSFSCIPALIRGRHIWDDYQFPPEELETRRNKLRRAMTAKGIDGLIIYADSLSCGYVSWLTLYNSVITWSSALLLFPAEGIPRIIASVPPRDTERIKGFIPPGTDLELAGLSLVANDHIGGKAAEYLHKNGLAIRKWAGVNLDELPHKAFSDIYKALGELPDFTEDFDLIRSRKTPAEISAVCQAASIAKRAALHIAYECGNGMVERQVSSSADRLARLDGAEDIQILIGRDKEGLRFPGDDTFCDGELVRVYTDVQYLRYHGIFGFSFTVGNPSSEQKLLLKNAGEKIKDIVSDLAAKRRLPSDYFKLRRLDSATFTSINGCGMDQVEAPFKGSMYEWPLEAGNVLAVTLEEITGNGACVLMADTFFMSAAGLISATGGVYD